ncbi:MAG: class I SAM-dependent methyltransferase [Planctomycetota bacterium]
MSETVPAIDSLRTSSGGTFSHDPDAGVLRPVDPADAEQVGQIPVMNGIPRFVRSEHLESFGRQWNRYEVAHDDEDRATFQAKTGTTLDELRGVRVLDAGCGGGRYCKVAGEAGATVVGADHSHAVDKAAKLCAHLPDVAFVQADLKRLPFEPASFDFVFSIGVMHHDADTRAVFDAVSKFVKPGGRYSVWLYRRNQWWQERINDALRARTTRMDPDRLEKLCRVGAFLGGVPVVKSTLNKVVSFSAHPDAENRLCDTFDWYAPAYQHHHTVEELAGWFEEAGFGDLRVLPPEKGGPVYRRAYENNLLIGSGVNVTGVRAS